MTKVELLAPAGDLEKLKVAILYGANAVFIGGEKFSLRSRASNFTLADIKEACTFAHAHNAKVHVTCNIVMHNIDLDGLLDYLKALEAAGVDAIITSSLYMMQLAKANTKMEVHVSTQESTTSSAAVKFYQQYGIERVVLARELTLAEITNVREHTKADLEVFIHGGMCASYSGRCMLSNNMTNRDANRGGCAHSCRWNYNLMQGDKKLNPEGDYFSLSSKDLCSIHEIPELIDIGINSFKIEGRMKSLHYVASITNTYRKLIDEYEATGKIKDFTLYEDMINKAENRLTSTGFLRGMVTTKEQLYDLNLSVPTKTFVGLVYDYDKEKKIAYIEQRNYFLPNSNLEVFTPERTFTIAIKEVFDLEGNSLDAARHPLQKIYFYCDEELKPYDMLRALWNTYIFLKN